MEILFHFIFEIIKITILSCCYATLVFVIFMIIGHFKPNSWFGRIVKKEVKLWLVSVCIIWLGLFSFMLTYHGDHGLGDYARVPIGYGKVVEQVDAAYAFLENSNREQISITNFTFDENNLYAETRNDFDREKGDFVVWNLRDDSWTFYKTKEDYLEIAEQNNYPTPDEFKDFLKFYKEHWSGWRFWLLP